MNIIAALLIFTVIVVIHELGHFLLAKKHGVGVPEFSVGSEMCIRDRVRELLRLQRQRKGRFVDFSVRKRSLMPTKTGRM